MDPKTIASVGGGFAGTTLIQGHGTRPFYYQGQAKRVADTSGSRAPA
jgi:hypothetical protein